MLFMVIETFREGARAAVYARLAERGRLLPEGVRYLDSWVEEAGDRCFQLMECDTAAQLDPWIAGWDDLVSFEVVPVISSAQVTRRAQAEQGGPEKDAD